MSTVQDIKEIVKQKYNETASQTKEVNQSSCCGSGNCSTEVYNIMSDDYANVPGYNPDADLGLGCGLPTEFASIKQGNTVIDLGSGAGNDCFVARTAVGEKGIVIGIDFTPAMIERARQNADLRGFNNVEFRQGDIENIPVSKNTADVVISNCVLNLVPNKERVFQEIFRILKSDGHFCISDIVLVGELPVNIKNAAEMYAGCVAGAIQKKDYLRLIEDSGFMGVRVQKGKKIIIPDDILRKYLLSDEITSYKESGSGIYSITVYAEISCCGPDALTCFKTC